MTPSLQVSMCLAPHPSVVTENGASCHFCESINISTVFYCATRGSEVYPPLED